MSILTTLSINSSLIVCSLFLDLLLSVAIDCGSYNALLWLQHSMHFNLHPLFEDPSELGAVHRIVNGNFAIRFFNDYTADEVFQGRTVLTDAKCDMY
jgi:hypothetical protein